MNLEATFLHLCLPLIGHGDGEDQLRPKLVEAFRDLRVVDVACGSGDAQTLCITSNDMVWSWGDGDYGKLGRGLIYLQYLFEFLK